MALSDQPRNFSFYGQGGTLFGIPYFNASAPRPLPQGTDWKALIRETRRPK